MFVLLALIGVGLADPAAAAPTRTISGTVKCNKGHKVAGVYVNSVMGGSRWASWKATSSSRAKATFSAKIHTDQGGKTSIRVDVGCGTKSGGGWWSNNTTKWFDTRGNSSVEVECNEASGKRAKRCYVVPKHNMKAPFAPGQKWYVYQGYRAAGNSHSAGYGLDLTISSSSTSTFGKSVRAIASGRIAWADPLNQKTGTICVNTPDGRSYDLTHVRYSRQYLPGDRITAGRKLGIVEKARPGTGAYPRNNNVAHLHLTLWAKPGCYGQGSGNERTFSTGNKARLCGFRSLYSGGPVPSATWRGQWGGKRGTVAQGC
jgi:hypothetical protein